jgi:hypothetical protein
MCKEKIRHYCCRLSLHDNFHLIENTHWCLNKYRNSRHKQFRKVYKCFASCFFRKVISGVVIDVWIYKETVGINNRSLGRCKCFPIFEIGNLQVLVEVLYPFIDKCYLPKTKNSIYLCKQSISIIIIIIIIIQWSIPGEGFSIPIYRTNGYIKIKIPIYSVYLKSICLWDLKYMYISFI